ncbi:MAG: glycosyltransferase family 2 protein [Caldilineaceae bacterium]|nr:glycosyltransferase family 2 protein [Caldilineaceae bacterium]
MPKASIILPTYNRLAQLQQVLAGLAAQTQPTVDFEVVVVSDGSTDGTNEFLQRYAGPLQLRACVQANGGAAAARNQGLALAQGELVIFLDDDVVPAPQLVAEHLRTHAQQSTACVVLGPMLTPTDFAMQPWVRWEQAMLYKQYGDMAAGRWEPTARQFYTGNASVARQHLAAVGGFDTTFRRAEDVELAYRLAKHGLGFLFNPQAIGYHYAVRSFSAWLQIPYLYGRNDVIFARDLGQDWLLPTVMQEFRQRHPLVKQLTGLCLSRPWLRKPVVTLLRGMASLGNHYQRSRLAHWSYSGIFNLCYYQGMADELGGRQHFFQLTRQPATAANTNGFFLFEGQ